MAVDGRGAGRSPLQGAALLRLGAVAEAAGGGHTAAQVWGSVGGVGGAQAAQV